MKKDLIVKKSKIEGKGVFAKRNIKKGEKITGDYSEDLAPGETIMCNCASKNCRGVIKNE